jgi:transposase
MGQIYVPQSKKNARSENALIIYGDEASFRQDPTLHRTWARRNYQPKILSNGHRNSQKILGAISLYDGQFAYRHQTEYFNAESYIDFLDNVLLKSFCKKGKRLYLIQDNASYHKKPEVYEFFKENRKKIEVFQLPSYSPDYNPIECVWKYTRKNSTHNRYFDSPSELCTSLFDTFGDIQKHPEKVIGLLQPFF